VRTTAFELEVDDAGHPVALTAIPGKRSTTATASLRRTEPMRDRFKYCTAMLFIHGFVSAKEKANILRKIARKYRKGGAA
jgi:hypothetical protein